MDRARRPRPQPVALDTTARTPRHHHSRWAHPAQAAASPPRPPDPPRTWMDASPPRPLALARRLHHSAGAYPRAARPDLTAPRRAYRQRARPHLPGASPATANTARQPAAARQLPRRAPIMPRNRTRPATAEVAAPTPRHPATPSVDPGLSKPSQTRRPCCPPKRPKDHPNLQSQGLDFWVAKAS
jgi:hypothetical protein